jgi:hypothetical protein
MNRLPETRVTVPDRVSLYIVWAETRGEAANSNAWTDDKNCGDRPHIRGAAGRDSTPLPQDLEHLRGWPHCYPGRLLSAAADSKVGADLVHGATELR